MTLKQSGIYRITNLINGKFYIGSSHHTPDRWSQHKSQLRLNKHGCRYLQRAWNKHGEVNFVFEVIEVVCDRQQLIVREQFWLDATKCYDSSIGYNVRLVADSNYGLVPSDEHRQKISEALTGLVRSEETKAKMSAWQIGRKMSDEANAKNAKSTRKFDKWPHDDGAFCKCRPCTDQRSSIHREHMKKKKLEKSMIFVSDHIQAMLMGI